MEYDFEADGLKKNKLKMEPLLKEIQQTVNDFFYKNTDFYIGLEKEEYRQIVSDCQYKLNELGFSRRLVESELQEITSLIGNKISIQTNLYLRATRPNIKNIQEAIGWHRESFYGNKELNESISFWLPIKNLNANNTLRYIPKSHKIPDENIICDNIPEQDSSVPRFSSGHTIGLQYSPKIIKEGVPLDHHLPMNAQEGEYIIFDSKLIHGNASNSSNEIRYSIDFRLIPSSLVKINKPHFASGKGYWEEIEA